MLGLSKFKVGGRVLVSRDLNENTASTAVEAVFSFKSLETKTLPPTLNLDNPSTNTSINLIPHEAISKGVSNIISNSFGFGGTNASIIIGD